MSHASVQYHNITPHNFNTSSATLQALFFVFFAAQMPNAGITSNTVIEPIIAINSSSYYCFTAATQTVLFLNIPLFFCTVRVMSAVVHAVLSKSRSSPGHRKARVHYLSSLDNCKSRSCSSDSDMNTVHSLNVTLERPSTITYW